MTQPRLLARVAATLALALTGLGAVPAAHAENHALILWIGDYGGRNNLPGIDRDAAMARQIALGMGVPADNIVEVSNTQLTRNAMAQAFSSLYDRIAQDDKVFIYYSGHGMQVAGADGAKCTEGMVTRDPALFEDFNLQSALTALGRKSSQLVFMNDSCFSGGAATKQLRVVADDFVPKFYSGTLPAGAAVSGDQQCGDAVNKMGRNMQALAAQPRAPQVLYIAASAADQVSLATSRGSLATLAWAQCLRTGDADRSGAIDGEELRACAQRLMDGALQGRRQQTLTLVGNTRLPLAFTASGAGSPATSVDPVRTLANIQAMRDPSHQVVLQAARTTLRIDQDELDFSVNTSQAGYLYVLHVGSDGMTFDLLFPNAQDTNNRVNAGNHALPRPTWRVRVAGPVGTSRLMAVVSPRPLDMSKGMDMSSLFPHAIATADNAKNLVSASTGRFGVSEIVDFREVR